MKQKSDCTFWFIGNGDFAALLLPMLSKNFNFKMIITRSPSKAKRGLREEVTPVERAATETGHKPVRTPLLAVDTSINNVFQTEKPDGIFVIDFGEIIAEPFLTGTKFGCLNIHPSFLPKYRGAAPIQRALERGEPRIGTTLFKLVKEMDAGPIISQMSEEIFLEDSFPDIMNKAAILGNQLANEWLDRIAALPNQDTLYPQDQKAATYAPKVLKTESHQSFSITASLLHNRVRAFYPNPGVWVPFRGKRLKLIATYPLKEASVSFNIGEIIGSHEGKPIIKCKEGALILKQVQPEGKRIIGGEDWVNGFRLKSGDIIE
jgi:methionyl-tRNA formyltransferase